MNVSRKRSRSDRSRSAKRFKANSKTRYTNQYPVARVFRPISGKAGQGNNIISSFIYASPFSLNGGAAGAAATYQFSLSSLFDPDLSGVGEQPTPFDQYAAIYEAYRVFEVSFKVVMFSGDATIAQLAGYIVSDSATTSTDVDRYIRNGQCEWLPMGPKGSSSDTITLKGTCDIARAHGVSRKKLMTDDIYSAEFTASPPEQIFLTIFVASPGGNDPGAGECYIELRYKASLEGNQLVVIS